MELSSKYDADGNAVVEVQVLEPGRYRYVWGNVDPLFSTSAGEVRLSHAESYTTLVTDEPVRRETTKSELKRLGQ